MKKPKKPTVPKTKPTPKQGNSKLFRPTATLTLEALEPRILLSGTWVDADTGAAQSNAENGDDVFTGTDVADTAHGLDGNDSLFGLAGGDHLFGDDGDDVLDGGADSDTLKGEDGNDILLGGEGNDTLDGGDDDDTLDGGTEQDTLKGGKGQDVLTGGAGNDTLKGGEGNDTLDAGTDDDLLQGGKGDDILLGGLGHDKLHGGSGNDTADGGQGNDKIQGGKGDDALLGGEGNDVLKGDAGLDTLDGGEGDDILKAGKDDDTLSGGAGSDRLVGGSGNDWLDAGANDDRLDGGTGNDTLLGGEGQDTLTGGKGNDTLDGGAGNDTLQGGEGDDILRASGGNDFLRGGKGSDTFEFANAQAGDVYTVKGGQDQDTIDLSTFAAEQVQQSAGRLDVTLAGGGSFVVHHANIEKIKIGGNTSDLDVAAEIEAIEVDSEVDDEGSDSSDEAPFADAGQDVIASPGSSVTLDASQSAAMGSENGLTYNWRQLEGPSVVLSDGHAAQPTFLVPSITTPTVLTFEVEVSDSENSSKDIVTITIDPDEAPIADAGTEQTVVEGATVQLSGSGTDPEGQNLTYQWVQTSGPIVTLSDSASATPTFLAPQDVGTSSLTFELRTSDGTNISVDTVTIRIQGAAAPAVSSGVAAPQVSEIPAMPTPDPPSTPVVVVSPPIAPVAPPIGAPTSVAQPFREPDSVPEPVLTPQPQEAITATSPAFGSVPTSPISTPTGAVTETELRPETPAAGSSSPTNPATSQTGTSAIVEADPSPKDEGESYSNGLANWDGSEQLSVLNPSDELRDTVELSPVHADAADAEWKPTPTLRVADFNSVYAEDQVFELAEPVVTNLLESSWLPSGTATTSLEEVFTEVELTEREINAEDPTGGLDLSAPRRHTEAWTATKENALQSDHHAGVTHSDQSTDPHTPLPTDSWNGTAPIDSVPAEPMSLFARLWGVVRGFGGTGGRGMNLHANASKEDS